jgi:protein involved in polysaccharide export with SLBB domain
MRFVALAVFLATFLPFVTEGQERFSTADVYKIGPKDVLRIAVWKNEAMSRTATVRPDGKISLPLLNEVQAAGLTTLELRGVLTERLREFIQNPEVSVVVTDVRSIEVCGGGETTRPGCYQVRSGTLTPDAPTPADTPLMWDGLLMRSGKPFPR